MKCWTTWTVVALALVAACNGAHHAEEISAKQSALTAEQCSYFEIGGTTQICHATSSPDHPYTILRVSEKACINAHAAHRGDYVTTNDPTCRGKGCLPAGAPCDQTRPCCGGFTCMEGTCQCAPNLDTCDGFCVDTTSDVSNCGTCGNVCPIAAECVEGTCQCASDELVCDGACDQVASDSYNCGACGNVCPSGSICQDSTCSCGVGGAMCHG